MKLAATTDRLEERVPKDHPLRTIKTVADKALERLSVEFDRMYSKVGRASVPPERLLKPQSTEGGRVAGS